MLPLRFPNKIVKHLNVPHDKIIQAALISKPNEPSDDIRPGPDNLKLNKLRIDGVKIINQNEIDKFLWLWGILDY